MLTLFDNGRNDTRIRSSRYNTLMMVTDKVPEVFITSHIKTPTILSDSPQNEADIRALHG